jgi:phosphopantothenate---cysteine ligase (CTP)
VHCLVTAGPTYEPLDRVRRLTNFSTGQLGTELAAFLTTSGHAVTLLIGEQATYRGVRLAEAIETFGATADLRARLAAHGSGSQVQAVFHAAAVSDFGFGKIMRRTPGGELEEVRSGKISTREGKLLAELVPTEKIIASLRTFFPTALVVGWKFDVEGDQASVIEAAKRQTAECSTDACVANGPAYGLGFAVIEADGATTHWVDNSQLFQRLAELMKRHSIRSIP